MQLPLDSLINLGQRRGQRSDLHCVTTWTADYDPGPARQAAHPRGRVAYEERSRYLPGLLWRPI